jgi:hypothetical protein
MIEFSFHHLTAAFLLAESRTQLFPERRIIDLAVSLRRRRLRGTYRIGRRKAADKPGIEFFVHFLIGQKRITGIIGVFVMRRGVEFLSHLVPPF